MLEKVDQECEEGWGLALFTWGQKLNLEEEFGRGVATITFQISKPGQQLKTGFGVKV